MDETQSLSSFPVDLNSAGQAELEDAGLSAALASAVLEYRAANGPFGSIDELLEVPGFDQAALDALAAGVTVDLSDGPGADVEMRAFVSDESEILQPASLDGRETPSDVADEGAAEDQDIEIPGEDDLIEALGAEEAEPTESILQPEPDSSDAVVVPEAESDEDEPVEVAEVEENEAIPGKEGTSEAASIPEADISQVHLQGEELVLEERDVDSDVVGAAASDARIAGRDVAVEGLADEADQAVEAAAPSATGDVLAAQQPPDSLTGVTADDAYGAELADANASDDAAQRRVEEDDKVFVAPPEELATLEHTAPPVVSEGVSDLMSLDPGHDETARTVDDAAGEASPDEGGAADVAGAPAPQEALGRQSEASATTQAAPRERSRWHDVGMIALGGLLGVLATLVILGVVGGTLNYAPRRLVDAMNDNLAVMQANQETTWSETQALVARADALDRRLSALEGLDDRIAALESGSAETESRLADTVAGLTQMDTQLAELAQSQALMFEEVDGRISGQEREISVLNEAVTSARETLQGIQDQVARYEAFFDALRSLLDDMQESAATETGA